MVKSTADRPAPRGTALSREMSRLARRGVLTAQTLPDSVRPW